MTSAFEKMCRRQGGYSLPWLIKISNGTDSLYFINDKQSKIYEGETYIATTFEYIPNADVHGFGGGGTLNIATADAYQPGSLLTLLEESEHVGLDVKGILLEDGTVTEIKTYRHSYGSVRYDGEKAAFTFEEDDRLSMTFPALVFSHYNNRGGQ